MTKQTQTNFIFLNILYYFFLMSDDCFLSNYSFLFIISSEWNHSFDIFPFISVQLGISICFYHKDEKKFITLCYTFLYTVLAWLLPALELYPLSNYTRTYREVIFNLNSTRSWIAPAILTKKVHFWSFLTLLAKLKGWPWNFQIVPALELYPLLINTRITRIVSAGGNHASTVLSWAYKC